ncbi:MAG: GNAT family N-acetyltransferase [Fuerstiella sp.]
MMSDTDIQFRLAIREDLATIVGLLLDDPLGSQRETASHKLQACYLDAFDAIEADPGNELIVAEQSDVVVGTLQITYTPNLTHQGSMRATIEGVRVSSKLRGSGIGTQMLQWAIQQCRARECRIVQLTSDLTRDDAISFYKDLGFEHTHAGMKLKL